MRATRSQTAARESRETASQCDARREVGRGDPVAGPRVSRPERARVACPRSVLIAECGRCRCLLESICRTSAAPCPAIRAAAVTLPCAAASTRLRYALSNSARARAFAVRKSACAPSATIVGALRPKVPGASSIRISSIIGQQQLAVDPVLELADVARPVVLMQPRRRVGMQPLGRKPVLVGRTAEEVLSQQIDVAVAEAERRNRELEDIQPIQQVAPETSLVDEALESLIRRDDDTDVGRNLARRPDRAIPEVLKEPQQRHLRLRRQRVHFVEKERSAIAPGR